MNRCAICGCDLAVDSCKHSRGFKSDAILANVAILRSDMLVINAVTDLLGVTGSATAPARLIREAELREMARATTEALAENLAKPQTIAASCLDAENATNLLVCLLFVNPPIVILVAIFSPWGWFGACYLILVSCLTFSSLTAFIFGLICRNYVRRERARLTWTLEWIQGEQNALDGEQNAAANVGPYR